MTVVFPQLRNTTENHLISFFILLLNKRRNHLAALYVNTDHRDSIFLITQTVKKLMLLRKLFGFTNAALKTENVLPGHFSSRKTKTDGVNRAACFYFDSESEWIDGNLRGHADELCLQVWLGDC